MANRKEVIEECQWCHHHDYVDIGREDGAFVPRCRLIQIRARGKKDQGFLPFKIIKRDLSGVPGYEDLEQKIVFEAPQTGGIPDECPLPLDQS